MHSRLKQVNNFNDCAVNDIIFIPIVPHVIVHPVFNKLQKVIVVSSLHSISTSYLCLYLHQPLFIYLSIYLFVYLSIYVINLFYLTLFSRCLLHCISTLSPICICLFIILSYCICMYIYILYIDIQQTSQPLR